MYPLGCGGFPVSQVVAFGGAHLVEGAEDLLGSLQRRKSAMCVTLQVREITKIRGLRLAIGSKSAGVAC